MFTALHVKPPTAQGLIGAIESKYKISGNSIRFLFKQNREGHKVKIDDDMITYYSNEAAFLMQVKLKNFVDPAMFGFRFLTASPSRSYTYLQQSFHFAAISCSV